MAERADSQGRNDEWNDVLGSMHQVKRFVHTIVVSSIFLVKKDRMSNVARAKGQSLAIPDRSQLSFHCAGAKRRAVLIRRLDDLGLIALCKERENDPTIRILVDAL